MELEPTPMGIIEAAQQGNLHVIQSLIVSGQATPNDRDSANTTPLHWAAINSHRLVVEFLVGAGSEIDALGGDLVSTPLHWAIRQGHQQVTTKSSKKKKKKKEKEKNQEWIHDYDSVMII